MPATRSDLGTPGGIGAHPWTIDVRACFSKPFRILVLAAWTALPATAIDFIRLETRQTREIRKTGSGTLIAPTHRRGDLHWHAGERE